MIDVLVRVSELEAADEADMVDVDLDVDSRSLNQRTSFRLVVSISAGKVICSEESDLELGM